MRVSGQDVVFNLNGYVVSCPFIFDVFNRAIIEVVGYANSIIGPGRGMCAFDTLGYSYDSYSYCSLVQPFVAPVAVKRRDVDPGNAIHGVALGEQGSHTVDNVEIGPVGELV